MEEQKEEVRTKVGVEGQYIEVWKVETTSTRRGQPFKHFRTERICIWNKSKEKICGKSFHRKNHAEKHVKGHLNLFHS